MTPRSKVVARFARFAQFSTPRSLSAAVDPTRVASDVEIESTLRLFVAEFGLISTLLLLYDFRHAPALGGQTQDRERSRS